MVQDWESSSWLEQISWWDSNHLTTPPHHHGVLVTSHTIVGLVLATEFLQWNRAILLVYYQSHGSQQADSLRVHFASNELRMSIDGNFTVSGWLVLVGRWNKKKGKKRNCTFCNKLNKILIFIKTVIILHSSNKCYKCFWNPVTEIEYHLIWNPTTKNCNLILLKIFHKTNDSPTIC